MPIQHQNTVYNKPLYSFSYIHQILLRYVHMQDTMGSPEITTDTFKLINFKPHLPRSFYFIDFFFYLILSREWCLNKNENHQSYDRFFSFSQFSSVQSLCRVWLFVTPWTVVCQSSLSITNSQSLLKLMSIESVTPSNDLILCHPLLLLSFPAPGSFPMSVLHIRWPKYWSFSFSISSSNEYSGLVSFRIDWLDFLRSIQNTLTFILLKLLFCLHPQGHCASLG